VRVIAKRTLRAFWEAGHPDAQGPLKAWHKEAEKAQWAGTADIKARYGSASFLPGNRVVFNIRGNTYRLIVRVRYDLGIVFIRWVGTHAAYDRIDATTI
jgi:mRNA interferase HigB